MLLHDWYRWVHDTWRKVAYIARYGRGQQVDMVARWPLSKLDRMVKIFGEMIREEQKRGGSLED